MMRYQLWQDWPVTQSGVSFAIPASTVIDTSLQESQWLAGIGPPLGAIALDQFTWNFMTSTNGIIGLGYVPQLVRPGPGVTGLPPYVQP
jgi:hypothetical protein